MARMKLEPERDAQRAAEASQFFNRRGLGKKEEREKRRIALTKEKEKPEPDPSEMRAGEEYDPAIKHGAFLQPGFPLFLVCTCIS